MLKSSGNVADSVSSNIILRDPVSSGVEVEFRFSPVLINGRRASDKSKSSNFDIELEILTRMEEPAGMRGDRIFEFKRSSSC